MLHPNGQHFADFLFVLWCLRPNIRHIHRIYYRNKAIHVARRFGLGAGWLQTRLFFTYRLSMGKRGHVKPTACAGKRKRAARQKISPPLRCLFVAVTTDCRLSLRFASEPWRSPRGWLSPLDRADYCPCRESGRSQRTTASYPPSMRKFHSSR